MSLLLQPHLVGMVLVGLLNHLLLLQDMVDLMEVQQQLVHIMQEVEEVPLVQQDKQQKNLQLNHQH